MATKSCPCGYQGHPEKQCTCNPVAVQRYVGRISGPLLDRIDLHVHAAAVGVEEMQKRGTGEPSAVIRQRVRRAREVQLERFRGRAGVFRNAQMSSKDIEAHCALDAAGQQLLTAAMKRLSLSARAFDRILKVARTLADLSMSERIGPGHIGEAVQYRTLDRGM